MAPEAPADTAGPSSPPPQLPEGWLPQWEGVRRQWYYVQRTTGKSQWEIPTEPIHLTPSTTPSIGGGPSQAPHQTNNSTRGVEFGNDTAGDNYPAVDSARISSSLDPQVYLQSEAPLHGTGVPGWYPNQPGQHLPGGYEHQPANAGYGPNSIRHDGGQVNGAQPEFYANQAHPGYPNGTVVNIRPTAWGNNGGGFQGQPDAYNMGIHPDTYQGYPPGAAAMHGNQPPATWTVTGNQQEHMNRVMAGERASQPQWQSEVPPGHMGTVGDKVHTSTLSQPFYGSYPSPQHTEQSPREYGNRGMVPPGYQDPQQYQPAVEKFPSHSPQSMVDQARFQSYPVSRTKSQHTPKDPALQGFSPLQQAQTQYQQQHLIRTHSGSEVPNVWSGGQGQHGSNQHPNPLAQISPNQFVPRHQMGHEGSNGYPDTTHAHQMPYLQSNHYPMQSAEGTGRPTGSQFVSGPWTSTPPSSGPL
ncbi:unnamed protein product [Penicillium salamii]|nr:unnamed protein product [Penicillium salamii]CAG8394610.1 unnamed protein product [Penicillium salamii]